MRPPPTRVYRGHRRLLGGATVEWCNPGGPWMPLNARHTLRNHSPDGFEWGYGGSGPAQLALALVDDATGSEWLALRTYQRFKEDVIAALDGDDWTLTAADIAAYAHKIDHRRTA